MIRSLRSNPLLYSDNLYKRVKSTSSMNSPSNHDRFWKQQRIAKKHEDRIIHALRILKKATSGPITDFMNKQVETEIEKEYEPKYLFGDRESTDKEKRAKLEDEQITQRGVQLILPRLEAKGLVFKVNYEYSLTNVGQAARIFAESYGKTLFDQLRAIPLDGTDDEKILECVKRLGLYIAYVFIRNSSPSVVSSFYDAIEENDKEWITEVIDLNSMFEWFTNKIYSKKQKYSSRTQKHFKLMSALRTQFPKYIPTLLKSESEYYKKAFPEYYKAVILKKIRSM